MSAATTERMTADEPAGGNGPALIIEVQRAKVGVNTATRRVAEHLLRGAAAVWYIDPVGRTMSVHDHKGLVGVLDEMDELPGKAGLKFRVADLLKVLGEAAA